MLAELEQERAQLKEVIIEEEGQEIVLVENEAEKKKITAMIIDSCFLRGEVLHFMKKTDQALADLSTVIELRPSHVDALVKRGEIYMEKGDFRSAMKDFKEARQWDPNNVDALYYSASLLRMHLRNTTKEGTEEEEKQKQQQQDGNQAAQSSTK